MGKDAFNGLMRSTTKEAGHMVSNVERESFIQVQDARGGRVYGETEKESDGLRREDHCLIND